MSFRVIILNNILLFWNALSPCREGTGIQIDSDLRYGKSERCLTFDNDPLVAGGDFEVQVIEVFAFSIM